MFPQIQPSRSVCAAFNSPVQSLCALCSSVDLLYNVMDYVTDYRGKDMCDIIISNVNSK